MLILDITLKFNLAIWHGGSPNRMNKKAMLVKQWLVACHTRVTAITGFVTQELDKFDLMLILEIKGVQTIYKKKKKYW